MVLEQKPSAFHALKFPPADSEPHKVHSGESWDSVAAKSGLTVWDLIDFNFPIVKEATTLESKCRQVNWLMRNLVGCSKSSDGKNYSFDSTDSPGVIYAPRQPDDRPTNLAALRIFGTPIPAGLPVWSRWNASSYQEAVRMQCAKLYSSSVGGAVLNALRRTVAIRPLKHYRDFLPVYVPSERSVYYLPGVFMQGSRAYVPASELVVGATADAALLHELVHAMRDTNGRRIADQEEMTAIQHPPWTSGNKSSQYLYFGKRGEFNAIIITNIYLSEVNPGRLNPMRRDFMLLVKDHHLGHANMGLPSPKSFHQTPKVRHYLKLLWDDQGDLCTAIARVNCEFNPIRDYKKES
jgi:hypothetical protein